jgi:hypothetical protein
MPYTHKKVGSKFVVYKKGKKVGETEGTKTALNKYLAALHIADKKSAKKESIKESVEEVNKVDEAMGYTDNVHFWMVQKPESDGADPQELVYPGDEQGEQGMDPFTFGKIVMGGLKPSQVYGFYLSKDEALNAAHDIVVAVNEAAKALEEKKIAVTSKIEEAIKKLQKEVNRCMEEGLDEKAQMYLQKISELRSKSQMVEASKKPIEEKKDKK